MAAALASFAAAASDADLTRLEDVPVGQCYIEHVDAATGRIPGVVLVPCAGPHQLELFGRGTIPYASEAPYPGDDAVAQAADEVCRPLFAAYVGRDYDTSVYIFWYYAPDYVTWILDRRVDCAIGNEARSMMPGGSARSSGR